MSVYDFLKDAVKIAQKADNIELMSTLLSIQSEAISMAEKIQVLSEENRSLKNEILASKDREEVRSRLKHRDNMYWYIGVDSKEEGPYCTRCWDKLGILMRVLNYGSYFNCPECDIERAKRKN